MPPFFYYKLAWTPRKRRCYHCICPALVVIPRRTTQRHLVTDQRRWRRCTTPGDVRSQERGERAKMEMWPDQDAPLRWEKPPKDRVCLCAPPVLRATIVVLRPHVKFSPSSCSIPSALAPTISPAKRSTRPWNRLPLLPLRPSAQRCPRAFIPSVYHWQPLVQRRRRGWARRTDPPCFVVAITTLWVRTFRALHMCPSSLSRTHRLLKKGQLSSSCRRYFVRSAQQRRRQQ